jgi:hypothetical protein
MVTHRATGVTKPVDRLQLSVATPSTLSPVPTSVHSALADPHWRRAMEYEALLSNSTWALVPRPPGANVDTGKWIFKHMLKPDGSLDRYKAHWVLRSFTQRPRVDYDETLNPTVKPATVQTVLTLGVGSCSSSTSRTLSSTALSETVYCSQSAGFVDPMHPQLVYRLNKSLYGLNQAPRAWYHCFTSYLVSLGFMEAKSDTSLFVYRRGTDTAYLLLYVDDIVLTASSPELLQRTTTALQQQFTMKDLSPLHHFIGVLVEQRSDSLFLHQRQYARDILERAGMSDYKPCSTPVATQAKVSTDMGAPSVSRLLTAAWLGLSSISPSPSLTLPMRFSRCASTCTTPVSPISRPRSASFSTSSTPSTTACFFTAPLHRTSSSTLMLTGSVVPTLAGLLQATRCSWVTTSSPGPRSVRTSSLVRAEAEYCVVANGVAEACWLRQLLVELHSPLSRATLVYCDNVSAIYLSTNPIQHQRTKHVEIDLHFVRERVAVEDVCFLHVPTTSQFDDIFTKGLPSSVFSEFRSSLNIYSG